MGGFAGGIAGAKAGAALGAWVGSMFGGFGAIPGGIIGGFIGGAAGAYFGDTYGEKGAQQLLKWIRWYIYGIGYIMVCSFTIAGYRFSCIKCWGLSQFAFYANWVSLTKYTKS